MYTIINGSIFVIHKIILYIKFNQNIFNLFDKLKICYAFFKYMEQNKLYLFLYVFN